MYYIVYLKIIDNKIYASFFDQSNYSKISYDSLHEMFEQNNKYILKKGK